MQLTMPSPGLYWAIVTFHICKPTPVSITGNSISLWLATRYPNDVYFRPRTEDKLLNEIGISMMEHIAAQQMKTKSTKE